MVFLFINIIIVHPVFLSGLLVKVYQLLYILFIFPLMTSHFSFLVSVLPYVKELTCAKCPSLLLEYIFMSNKVLCVQWCLEQFSL